MKHNKKMEGKNKTKKQKTSERPYRTGQVIYTDLNWQPHRLYSHLQHALAGRMRHKLHILFTILLRVMQHIDLAN
uniref:Uncharacterized protein n=1 Tax=Anguilla anguilla TaxID=7936 RepID=A0A0E9WIW8_ANGAN